MKYLISILFIFILSGIFLFAQYGPFGGGDGTKNNPYQIYNHAQLMALADSVLFGKSSATYVNWSRGKYFILMNSISSVTRPIGHDSPILYMNGKYFAGQSRFFQGSFDGQGHTITLAFNLNLPPPDDIITEYYLWYVPCYGNCGLFPEVRGNAEIKNLIVNGYIRTNHNTTTSGTICGIVGTYTSDLFSDNTYASQKFIMKNCISMVNIYAEHRTISTSTPGIRPSAGIIKINYLRDIDTVLIEDCINMGNIESVPPSTGHIYHAAGIAAFVSDKYNNRVIINRCINVGYIKGDVAGGITVGNNNNIDIRNCVNIGIIEGTSQSGAIKP